MVMEEWVCGEGGGRREQQLMVVMRADEGIDRDNAVAAGPVLDHDGLTPSLPQPVRQQPRSYIGATAWAECQDEFHWPCWPGLVGRCRVEERRGKRDNGCQSGSGAEHKTPARLHW